MPALFPDAGRVAGIVVGLVEGLVEGLAEGVLGLTDGETGLVEGNLFVGLVEGRLALLPTGIVGLVEGLVEGLDVGLFSEGLFTFPGRTAGEAGFLYVLPS